MSGYVRIHRPLFEEHPAFRTDAEAMAFAWLIVKAQWKPTRVRYKGHSVVLERGQAAISVRDFARAMDRDKAWVERLLKRLKSETMIETRCETGVTIITICNYNEYQADAVPDATPRKTPRETEARQRRDTEQRREEGKKDSVAIATGGEPPDPVKELFDVGVSTLTACGHTEKQARSLIGKWRKARTDGEVLTGLIDCRARAISSPVEWLEKRFAPSKQYVSKSGYRYRGDMEAVQREAERRADWDTYWQIEVDRKQAANG